MTPAEILNKKFDKGMGGYKTDEVHLFLSQVADYVTDLEEEKAELQEKLEILAEKLEQYKEDEESLRAALIGAQKLGQSVVRDSQRKAEAVLAQAARKAEEMVADAQRNIDKEALALTKMQRDVASFREKIIRLYSEHLEIIRTLPGDGELPDVEITQIEYTPPHVQSLHNYDSEAQIISEEIAAPELAVVGAEMEGSEGLEEDISSVHVPHEESDAFPKRKNFKGLEQIGQFFGEDKPIERQ